MRVFDFVAFSAPTSKMIYLYRQIAEYKKIEVKSAAHIISASVLDQTNTFTTLKLSEFSQLPSMSSLQTMKESLADMALANFCQMYGLVRDDLGSQQLTPSEIEMFKLMRAKIAECNVDEPVYEHDAIAKSFQPSQMMRSPVEDEGSVQVQPDEAPKKFNLSATDLKKKPLKITRNELADGEMTESTIEVVFPYLAGINYDQCQSIKVNGGLFTPCLTRPSKGSTFCKSCIKADHKDGIMDQRTNCSMLCYENPKGKKEISFGTWLKKRGLERADVEPKIQDLYDVTLPEEYWSVDKSKANRAVKTVSTSSDDEASVEGEKLAPKKRGRPKKVSVVSADDAEVSVANVEAPESPKVVVVGSELEEEPPVQEEPAPAEEEPPVQEEPSPAEEEPVCSLQNVGDESDDDLVSDSESEDEEEEDSPPKPPAKAVEVEPPKAPVKTATKKPLKKVARKDGVPYTRSDGRRGLMWQGKECVIDEDEDNEVSEISGGGLEKAIGYWNPDTKTVQDDPIE